MTCTMRFCPGLLALLLILAGCQSAPYTGRSQLLLMSPEEEGQMGLQAYSQVLKSEKISTNQAWQASLDRVGQRIAAAADRPDYDWKFTLIASPNVNAFALPGGKVAFYEGIMPVCRDDIGVAVVMGHEVAHALARHGNERVSQGMLARFGQEAASKLAAGMLGTQDPSTRALIDQGLGIATQVGVMLPFSRTHESEADHIGLILMAKAGYDPREAPRFWKRMATGGGQRPPEWLSTHPHPKTRIAQLQKWMPEALRYYQEAKPQGERISPAKK